ncbi:hypothetical protein MTR_4g109750 [Medicago truncatula]|uniref:Uncharacterized protein n=1 Tax=Medicago truncatula TaxID=3880 RepID=A0A072USJ0_MEDTR|nr:hypothetical protein MTR_4g109750 [Medicago truncatula]
MCCVHLAEVGLSLLKPEDIMQLRSYMLFIYLQPIVKGEGPEVSFPQHTAKLPVIDQTSSLQNKYPLTFK